METGKKRALINRLRTIRGHIAGIEKMIEEEKDCEDILMQMAAVTSSMKKTESLINRQLADKCVEKALAEGKDVKQLMAEILDKILK